MKQIARASIVLLLLFVVGTHVVAPQCAPTTDPPLQFLTRYGMASGTLLSDILGKPTQLQSWAEPRVVDGNKRLRSEVEYHVAYPIPFDQVADVMLDVERQEEFIGTMLESEVLCTQTNGARYYRQYTLTEFRWSLFTRQYEQILNLYVETPEPTTTYRSRFVLDESLDGKMHQTRGSWYAEGVVVDGVEATYIRAVQQVTFVDNPFDVRIAIKRVTTREMEGSLESIYAEAQDRMAERP